MFKCIKVLLPRISNEIKELYLSGFILSNECTATIYITAYDANEKLLVKNNQNKKDVVHGYLGKRFQKKKMYKYFNFIALDTYVNLRINRLVIHGNEVDVHSDCIIILYDLNKILKSETISESTDYVSKIQTLLQSKSEPPAFYTVQESININLQWLMSSMFIQHILNYIHLLNWLYNSFRRDKKVSIKQGNLILAIAMDVILGYIILQMFTQDTSDVSSMLMGILEKLINSLYSLLKWLMGAPVGLKLNNAFNKMLGKYFSYHVQLWWLFLDVSREKLDTILNVYHYIGYLGITFQTAIISDLICVATFHSYCIYVYAARLFNIQISGLIALLRLFVGRKYNPLRNSIDSCEYSNQELFVGTVAFTILLLLLPTTAMYYIVFTLFRVLSLIVQHILAKFIYVVQTLPLYVVLLWLTCSPRVAGNILIEVVKTEKSCPSVLRLKLFSKSITELINQFKPPVELPKQVEWTNLLSNIFVGKQIT